MRPDTIEDVHARRVDISTVNGEIDAIFDEGVVMWADQVADAGGRFLPLDPALAARRDGLVWDIGGPSQPPLPLERMVTDRGRDAR